MQMTYDVECFFFFFLNSRTLPIAKWINLGYPVWAVIYNFADTNIPELKKNDSCIIYMCTYKAYFWLSHCKESR